MEARLCYALWGPVLIVVPGNEQPSDPGAAVSASGVTEAPSRELAR